MAFFSIPKPRKPFFGEESLTPVLNKYAITGMKMLLFLLFLLRKQITESLILMKKLFITGHPTLLSQEFFLTFLPLHLIMKKQGSAIDQTKIINLTDKLQYGWKP